MLTRAMLTPTMYWYAIYTGVGATRAHPTSTPNTIVGTPPAHPSRPSIL
jgi:hypothetical protein